jgi:hypothetical protein
MYTLYMSLKVPHAHVTAVVAIQSLPQLSEAPLEMR